VSLFEARPSGASATSCSDLLDDEVVEATTIVDRVPHLREAAESEVELLVREQAEIDGRLARQQQPASSCTAAGPTALSAGGL